MILLRNISKGHHYEAVVQANTAFGGAAGQPWRIYLTPGQEMLVPKTTFKGYHPYVKQTLAEFAQSGLLAAYEIDAVHKWQDKGHDNEYDYDYLIRVPSAGAALVLTHALNVATSFHTEINAHFNDVGVHHAVVGAIAGNAPTDLATLLVWIGLAQTAYDTNHILSIVAHPFADATNTLAPIAAVDLDTAVQALQELHRAYHEHKHWYTGNARLDVPGIANY